MCGTPGVGKSTWIQNHKNYFAEETGIISRDAIRFNLVSENEEYFSKEKEVWTEFINQAKTSLEKNIDTILDATHLNSASRSKILRALKDNLNDVEINCIAICSSLDVILAQNNLREGTRGFVPKSAIRRMNSQFVLPSLDEGFDHIYIYTKEGDKVKYQILDRK